jgi:hypothetical protein
MEQCVGEQPRGVNAAANPGSNTQANSRGAMRDNIVVFAGMSYFGGGTDELAGRQSEHRATTNR